MGLQGVKMKVGLLVIGTEVLVGKISDLNTRYLAQFLRLHHQELLATLIVKDSESDIHSGLRLLFSQCDVVVTSGGLGPTLDDLTKNSLASYLGRNISFSAQALQVASDNYSRLQREYPGRDHGYSQLPDGFIALSNSTGFAPGLFCQHHDQYLLAAPGVPREFRSMIEDHFLRLTYVKNQDALFRDSITVRTRKIPEEKIFNEVDSLLWEKLSQYGSVSSLPVLMGVDIGVALTGSNHKEVEQKRSAVLKVFQDSPVSQAIWHTGEESLEEVIVKLATAKNITFAFAESCTGGLCANRITNISGASRSFLGSVVAYDPSVKMGLLGVNETTLNEFGAVSPETAEEMAKGLAQSLHSGISIAITGLAGPAGDGSHPVGTVFIGVSVQGQTVSHHHHFQGDRETLKNRFAQAALFYLWDELEKITHN
jgi:nicotinamide-nucleotide amidase